MRIAVACDHAGYPLKATAIEVIREYGFEILDLGTNSLDRVDYPDFAEKAGRVLQQGLVNRAIVICGSGIGACIVANKMKGIYAGLCHDTYTAHQGVEHDNMNVLCMGARVIGVDLAKDIIRSFLGAQFSGVDRYVVRVNKIKRLEKEG